MRRRTQKFLPIVLIALMLQIFAPIGACWAAVIAASDPLSAAEICHDAAAPNPGQPNDRNGQHSDHGGACAICCLASVSASVDTPKVDAFAVPYRETAPIAWRLQVTDFSGARANSSAQARAPPQSM